MTCFKPVPVARLTLMLGKEYYKISQTLIENKIVQTDGIFFKCKSLEYRVHPRFYKDTNLKKERFDYWFSTKDNKKYFAMINERKRFIEYFNELEIPFVELYKQVETKLGTVTLADFDHNEEIQFGGKKTIWYIDNDWNYIDLPKRYTNAQALSM